MGEHVATNYEPSICFAFWSTPPESGDEDEEPEMPDDIPAGNLGKVILAQYLSDQKDWKSDAKKIVKHKQSVFALVYAQLSESSRAEIKDDEEWTDAYNSRDLLYLIGRIRSTHIARQSGNPGQDKERVQQLWSQLRMYSHETSFSFRKRVEDHQLERSSVGLPVIPEDELVIGILNRLDMSRYATLTKDYFDNERRGIAELPEASSTLWKEIKDTQVIRFRGTGGGALESVYLTRADDIHIDGGRGRGRGGRSGGRLGGRGGRGRGRGAPETLLEGKSGGILKISSEGVAATATADIECWTCHQKGHRSSTCPLKRVHFAALAEDETVFYTSAETLQSIPSTLDAASNVFVATVALKDDRTILLDTQSSIHIVHSPTIAVNIHDTHLPVTIQGITGDRVRISQEATIRDIGIQGYYSPHMSANIISYHKLKETHTVHYNEETDTFIAIPDRGLTLTFMCVRGHYVMDLDQTVPIYVARHSSNYSAKQLTHAREAYEFIRRMGFVVSYKSAAEIIQRGSMRDITFSRSDLVNAQSIYGTPVAHQLGQGTQKTDKCREDDRIPLHESVLQELQVDIFYFLGQVFFLSISVLLGLVMVTHLGPGQDKTTSGTKATEGSRSKAGKALLHHLSQYTAKGFHVKTVTSDGEGSVKSVRSIVEELGVNVNILGHGSHAPHIESAIRHIKNKARSTLYSLPYPLPSRLAAALIAFVVHTANMVPKHNAPGHLPAYYTAFRGRAPSYKIDAPHSFGTTGFLQRPLGPLSNTSAPRADYCLWLGTTRSLKGTHRCFNMSTLAEITGDIFRPAPLTHEAVQRLRRLAGSSISEDNTTISSEEALVNPDEAYALDPNRGVTEDITPVETEIVPIESVPDLGLDSNPSDGVFGPAEITVATEADDPAEHVTEVSHSERDRTA